MTSEFFNKRLTKIQFQIGLKRFARLKRLRQVCDQIVVFWEEKASRFPPSPRHCEIYDQLSLHGSRTNLARQDLRYAIDCVFYGAGKDRPALYHQVEITTFVAEHLCNAQVESLVRNWCRGLFNLWPSDPQIFDLLALPLERFRAFSPTAQNLSQCHLNSLDAPRLLEQTIKPNDLVNEVQLKKTDRLSLGFSRFSNCLWENSLSRYGVLVEASRQNKCSLAEALAFIRSDSVLPSHTLRNLDAASAFVQSVLMPYNRQSGNFPSQEDQDQFWRFLNTFLEKRTPRKQNVLGIASLQSSKSSLSTGSEGVH